MMFSGLKINVYCRLGTATCPIALRAGRVCVSVCRSGVCCGSDVQENGSRQRHFRYETELASVGHAVERAVQYAKTTCRVWQCHWRLLSATVYALQSMFNNHLSAN